LYAILPTNCLSDHQILLKISTTRVINYWISTTKILWKCTKTLYFHTKKLSSKLLVLSVVMHTLFTRWRHRKK